LSVSEARSKAAGFFFLISSPSCSILTPYNGTLHVHCCVTAEVLYSSAETKLVALFTTTKELVSISLLSLKCAIQEKPLLLSMTIPLPFESPTLLSQGKFSMWKKGKRDSANFFTNNQPEFHHRGIWSTQLHYPSNPAHKYFQPLLSENEA
jgi:hypothetical protein